jgi:hypothetical protein
LAWQQMISPSEEGVENDSISLFKEVFMFIDNEENWKNFIKQPGINSFGINKGLLI